MTNLSKELCEICGIGYIIKCKHGEQFPQNCDCDYSCEECSAHQKIFPNFENPENFVKLQKLMIEDGMGFDIQLIDYPIKLEIRFCWDNSDFYFKVQGNSLEEVFLRFILQICELDKEGDIKHAIKETEWVYE